MFNVHGSVLREERRLRVFENRVLRRVFGPKRDEVTGEWRKGNIQRGVFTLQNIAKHFWNGNITRKI